MAHEGYKKTPDGYPKLTMSKRFQKEDKNAVKKGAKTSNYETFPHTQ